MKKRLSLVCLLLTLIAIFACLFASCIKEPQTLDSLRNDYGIVIKGGGFTDGSVLITEEIGADTADGAAALAAIADKEYDKDGAILILEIHVIRESIRIQPKNKVTVSVPMPDAKENEFIIFHVKADNSVEEIIPTLSDGKLSFETSSFSRFIFVKKAKCVHDWDDFRVIERATCTSKGVTERTCKLCGVTEQRETPEASHRYSESVSIEKNDCLHTGIITRVCEVCGNKEEESFKGPHTIGAWIEAKEPTFFETGCIGHYECSVCGGAFDEDQQPIDNAIIPRLTPKLSICLDGVPVKELAVDEAVSSYVILSASGIEVKAGQTLSICNTDDPDTELPFTVRESYLGVIGVILGNVDPETKKIRTDSVSSVTVEMTSGGVFTLSMDGYAHSGIVIEATKSFGDDGSIFLPMTRVDYYGNSDVPAYLYGTLGTDQYTSFRIIDLDTDTVYDYDDISPSMSWNTWSYSKGENGGIQFSKAITHWVVAFDVGGDGKIHLDKINYPSARIPTQLDISDGTKVNMEKLTFEAGSEEYDYYTWTLFNGCSYRTEVWLDYIGTESITVYRAVVDIDKNESFTISAGSVTLGYEYLCRVDVSGKLTTSGKGIKLSEADKYVVEYLPFCDVINIYEYIEETPDPEPHEHIYVDGKCECGAVDPDYVPSHEHGYVDGKCECGAVDSDYKGIVIEINGDRYAMNLVTYPTDGVNSYVYGYVYINAGDKLLIRDTESGAVWGYDDISEEFSWNTWDYHKGEGGEIVFDFAARYAFEFDYDGCKKLYITKVFAPNHGESFGIDFEGEREDLVFDSFDLSASAGAEDEFMWTLTHATTMNSSDFTEYINENGLWFYYAIIDLEEGERFSLKNLTTGGAIGADYMSDITGDITAITRDGDLVSVQKSGSFYIIYLPALNSFTVECDTTDPFSEIHIFADEELTLVPDENGDVFYNGLSVTASSYIMITDARNSSLPIILDETVDKSLVDVTVYGDYYYAYTNKAGTCNLKYNVYTGILYLEYVDSGEEEVSIPYQIYISYDNKLTLKENSENPDELCYLGLTLGAWDEFSVRDTELNYITDMTVAEGSDVVTNGRTITVQVGGTFDFYINKTTHAVRMVASTGGGAGGDVDYSDGLYLYLDSDFITVYPNADGDVKYVGIAATDETSIAFLDKSYNYLSMTLDPASDSSIAKVYGANMLFFYKTGTANIIYNVNTGIISVEMTDVSLAGAKVYMYLSGTNMTLTANESGIVTYEGLVVDSYSSMMLTDSAFDYLPMILDPETDPSIAELYEYGDTTMLIVKLPGVYNFYYDLNTGIVKLEVSEETAGVE